MSNYIDPETGKTHLSHLWKEPIRVLFIGIKPYQRRTVSMGKAHMDKDTFTLSAIPKLRTGKYRGIHSVFSGFNEAFKVYFKGENPVDHQKDMVKRGKLVTIPAKKGAMLYLPEDAPKSSGKDVTSLIAKITG